jgi:hypothetical protein
MLASGEGGRLLFAEPLQISGADAPYPYPSSTTGPTLADLQQASPFIAFGGNVP